MSLTAEEIEKNWNRFKMLCGTLGERSGVVLEMLNQIDERLSMTPASSKENYHNSFPGGLVDHSIRVLLNANKIVKAFEWSHIPKESLILACLFHDFGKMGDHIADYYIPQSDSWRAEKLRENYTYNNELTYMTVPDRSVWLLSHFGVKLTQDEFLAIKLNDGQYAKENEAYKLKEPALADAVHMADLIATKQEKGLYDPK